MIKQKADKLLIKNGLVIDFQQPPRQADIKIINGIIDKVGDIPADDFDGKVIDAANHVICPGLLDMHVHLREPGREDEETIETGCAAAMAGGFTGICPMPNTTPACDSQEVVQFLQDRAEKELVDIYPIGTITKKREGKEISEMADMKRAGAVAFSDDGSPVMNTVIMRYAFEYASMLDRIIIDHSEDMHLAADGHMNEGVMSTRLGIQGIPNAAESSMIARNIELARLTDASLHIAHISTRESVELVRRAKAEGLKVSCEVTPHHLYFCDEDLTTFDTNLKMNPPLRTKRDIDALLQGIKDGTVDVFASDHAPHSIEEKDVEFTAAPFGILGLETMLGVILEITVNSGLLSLEEALAKLSVNPRKLLGIAMPTIQKDAKANLSIFNPNKKRQVKVDEFQSLSKNSPFDGKSLPGTVLGVVNRGYYWLNAS